MSQVDENSEPLGRSGTWLLKIGAARIQDPGLTVDEITAYSGEWLDEQSLETLENLMARVASYNTYLKAQRDAREARLSLVRARLKYLLGLKTQLIEKKFMSAAEKESLVLAQNPDIMALHREAVELETGLVAIRNLPFAIDKKLELIKLKYNRRADEAHESRFEQRHSG